MLIGRRNEIDELKRLLKTDKSELVAVYGRRRVGKTFLINEVYNDDIVFRHTGTFTNENLTKKERFKIQLQSFYTSLIRWGIIDDEKIPSSWIEAFALLEKGIKDKYSNDRIVIFLDELPWMSTPNSFFLEAFSYFWNNFCVPSKNIVLVVCGSSSSWILNKVIYDKGGLYNRVTYQLRLLPFNLKEVEEFLSFKDIHYSRYEIAQTYMMVGGIPYYLDYFKNNLSSVQNVDELFFNENCHLPNEFDDLFSSQFSNHESFKKIIEILGGNGTGFSAKELSEKLNFKQTNGGLYEMLESLSRGGFIKEYIPFKGDKRITRYKLIDPFCLFYLKQISENKNKHRYLELNLNSPKLNSWRGIAFENLCLNHVTQIKQKLSILGIYSEESMWYPENGDKTGAQIDLIIDRKDNVINLCEMKFYSNVVTVDKEFHLNLISKMEALLSKISRKASIQNVLVTTYGLNNGSYASDFPSVITLDDLFA